MEKTQRGLTTEAQRTQRRERQSELEEKQETVRED
jgi:hypothetical protein